MHKTTMYHHFFYMVLVLLPLLSGCGRTTEVQDYAFDFSGAVRKGYEPVTVQSVYGQTGTYGYDFGTEQNGTDPFFFSVDLPEGNYRVTVVLGGEAAAETAVKSESRRLMLPPVATVPGERVEQVFTVNIRNKYIGETDSVRIKPREVGKLIWDDKLTLEFSGQNPAVTEIRIDAADELPTIFLAGNSTVVDEGNEPWCGWGQMFPAFLTADVVVANYAESGESARSFVGEKRLDKLLTQMKPGDWLFIEFGHNDQKQSGEGVGAYTTFKDEIKFLADQARKRGAIPVLVTPMHRRSFDENGRIVNTHGDYPDAVRRLAADEGIYLIDLNAMSKTLYEAWGIEGSKQAFVHFPAGTFPGQDEPLADNTHFNSYGGYEIGRCIVQGLRDNDIPLQEYIRPEIGEFDPAQPDDPGSFHIPPTAFLSLQKPDGN